jgi:hypothetical protein
MKREPLGTAAATDAVNDGPKKDPQAFRQLNSDQAAQGQALINEQPMEKKQQPANRPGSERGGSQK